jgi:hypothetical protein
MLTKVHVLHVTGGIIDFPQSRCREGGAVPPNWRRLPFFHDRQIRYLVASYSAQTQAWSSRFRVSIRSSARV